MTDRKRVPDTSKMPAQERTQRVLKGLMGQNAGCIERQEAQGQRDMVASAQLPVDGTRGKEEEWTALGVELLPERQGDIFRDVILPPGWKKVPTDHSMWSKLVDENGVERALIFYKAAFYDRSARVSFSERRED